MAHCRLAYRVFDNPVICPVGSDAEREAINRAFGDLHFMGQTSICATQPTHSSADSIRESIHAVESAVRAVEPQKDFSKAIAILETKFGIHGALKSGFTSSDENGIRHSLIDDPQAKVDETDALFMIGACAASCPTSSTKREQPDALTRPLASSMVPRQYEI